MKKALITGATKGIGRAIALKLAKEGYSVFLNSRTESDLVEFKTNLEKAYPSQLFYHSQADLSTKSGVEKLAHDVISEWNSLEVLVNNTGFFQSGDLMEEPEGQLEQQINTNLYSAYHLTRALIGLVKSSKGHIFNMCSVASITAFNGGGSYCISKFALLGFNKVLRKEMMSFGVKVTAILPGATWSDSWAGVDYPEERLMQADDIAQIILCSLNMSPSATMEEIIIRPQLGDL